MKCDFPHCENPVRFLLHPNAVAPQYANFSSLENAPACGTHLREAVEFIANFTTDKQVVVRVA